MSRTMFRNYGRAGSDFDPFAMPSVVGPVFAHSRERLELTPVRERRRRQGHLVAYTAEVRGSNPLSSTTSRTAKLL